MASEEEIAAVLELLFAALPGRESVSSDLVEAYMQHLADLPAGLLQEAAGEVIDTQKWFPAISELRQAARTVLERRRPVPHIYAAWAEVREQIRRQGRDGEPHFSHPLIARVVELFGWRDLCLSERLEHERDHFLRAYQLELDKEHARLGWSHWE